MPRRIKRCETHDCLAVENGQRQSDRQQECRVEMAGQAAANEMDLRRKSSRDEGWLLMVGVSNA